MDIELMATAIRDIQKLQPALDWLRQYGHLLVPSDKSCVVSITPLGANECVGVEEATAQLNAIGRLHIEKIVQHAMADAENTIRIRRRQLVEQASSGITL